MKTILIISILLLNSALVAETNSETLQVHQGKPHPQNGFSSSANLFKFAQSSSFGGGEAKEFEIENNKFVVINRSFTSGRPSSEISIYSFNPELKSYYLTLLLPTRPQQHRIHEISDVVFIQTPTNDYKNWKTVLSITEDFFYHRWNGKPKK